MKHIPVGVFFLALLFTAGCSRQAAAPQGSPEAATKGGRGRGGAGRGGAALVSTATVTATTVPVEIRAVGNVEAFSTIRVRAQVTGQLTKVYIQEGQDVKAGDLLFLIDPRPYDEAIRQAEANLARNTALLRQAEANLKRDQAQEQFAGEQAARYQKLFTEGVLSKQQTDQYLSDAAVRKEAVRASQAAIESAQASIKADTAAISNAKLQRSYCEIRAPIGGRTGDLLIKEGNLVRVTDAELVTIRQIHPVFVTFSAPENRLPEIRRYMASGKLVVTAAPPGDTAAPENGTLSFVDNTVDITTGSIRLKGTFPNAANRLWPGQFVNVVLRLTMLSGARVVPVRAVQIGQDGEYAYVVGADRVAEMRPVVTGIRVGEEVVVQKGLELGEVVVTEGQLRLAPGMRVTTRGGRGS
ncbi:MAG: efflux RND transporter periplasmic adaptor subunit [Bryobacterales bacterium]|nr:efflux RND transporter periplasmic adaptor subunit [Bryobacterales bacterium]